MAYTLFFFYSLIFVASSIFTKYFLSKFRNYPPSPFPTLPIIGHLHLLRRPLHRSLANLSNRHGPLISLQLGVRRVVVVSSPSLEEECFTRNDIVFASRPRLFFAKHISYNYTSLAWSSYGDHWRQLRKISSLEILSNHRLQLLSAIRAEEVRCFVSGLFEAKDRTVAVDMKKAISDLTTNIMMRMVAGKRYCGENVSDVDEAERFEEIGRKTVRLVGEATFANFLPWIKPPNIEKKLMELQNDRDGFMQLLVDEQRKEMELESSIAMKNNLIQVLLSLQKNDDPEYYTDNMIKSLLITLLVAGTETSLSTTEWALSLLVNHPQVLKKAQIEIDNLIGSDRPINEIDLPQLPYLCCIVRETLRIYPVLPLLLPHESSEECKLGGFRIPKGTMLFVNAWAMQNDPKVWAEPSKFKPERFEGLDDKGVGFKSMPFGYGRRSCPGEGLATRVVGLTLGSLIQCFEWERPEDGPVDMSEGSGFTLFKAQPLKLLCRPRPTMLNLLSQL